mmetsp:Transcript_29260/g.45837  ORF Transcript_29260/g.45837 Transcript_29260/m.45837 type:complete len:132 (-) Transcript_29260:182-577(-)
MAGKASLRPSSRKLAPSASSHLGNLWVGQQNLKLALDWRWQQTPMHSQANYLEPAHPKRPGCSANRCFPVYAWLSATLVALHIATLNDQPSASILGIVIQRAVDILHGTESLEVLFDLFWMRPVIQVADKQ